jgi:hypothetical protein
MRAAGCRTLGRAVAQAGAAAASLLSMSLALPTYAAPGGDACASFFRDPGGSVVFSARPPRVPFAMPAVRSPSSTVEPGQGTGRAGRAGQAQEVEPDRSAIDLSTGVASSPRLVTTLPDARTNGGSRGVSGNACTRELAGDFLCYRCGGVLYQPVYYGGRLVYRMVDE